VIDPPPGDRGASRLIRQATHGCPGGTVPGAALTLDAARASEVALAGFGLYRLRQGEGDRVSPAGNKKQASDDAALPACGSIHGPSGLIPQGPFLFGRTEIGNSCLDPYLHGIKRLRPEWCPVLFSGRGEKGVLPVLSSSSCFLRIARSVAWTVPAVLLFSTPCPARDG
jgi:hypothetical protein